MPFMPELILTSLTSSFRLLSGLIAAIPRLAATRPTTTAVSKVPSQLLTKTFPSACLVIHTANNNHSSSSTSSLTGMNRASNMSTQTQCPMETHNPNSTHNNNTKTRTCTLDRHRHHMTHMLEEQQVQQHHQAKIQMKVSMCLAMMARWS